MSSDAYPYPVAIARLSQGERSRDAQNARAVQWLLTQHGGPVVVVTPLKNFSGSIIKQLVANPRVIHRSWRGFSPGSLAGHRVLYAWPDRKRLDSLWGVAIDALVVIEWNDLATAEWIEASKPSQLFLNHVAESSIEEVAANSSEPLPNGVEGILRHVSSMAAGYSSGLKWNEEDMLKADMMNCPERWGPITVEQVRDKCRVFGMRPSDVDTVARFLQHRKDGRRFNIQSSYRTFEFERPAQMTPKELL